MTENTQTEIATTTAPPVPMPRPRAPRKAAPRGRYGDWATDDRWKYAQALAGAGDLIPQGLFETAHVDGQNVRRPSIGKIFLVLETGNMLGLEPMAALQGINVIEGRATISPQMMSGLLRRAGHVLTITKSGTVAGGDFQATATLIRKDDPEHPISDTWDLHRAARAGLCTYAQTGGVWKVSAASQSGKAKPWQSYPENMCVWRAVGVVGREGGDDVLLGVAYTAEEFGADVNADGEFLELGEDYEEATIAHLKSLDDRAQLAEFVQHLNREDGWTDRIQAEFDAHLMRTTKDSRPKLEGTPGRTGEPALDSVAAAAPEGHQEAISASASESPSEPSEAADGHVAAEIVEETEEERFERESREEFDRQQAETYLLDRQDEK